MGRGRERRGLEKDRKREKRGRDEEAGWGKEGEQRRGRENAGAPLQGQGGQDTTCEVPQPFQEVQGSPGLRFLPQTFTTK